MRLSLVAVAVSLSILALARADEASAALRAPIDIPEQSLSSALQSLARQRSLQVICRADLVAGLRTRGVTGDLTAIEALSRLLGGTALSFQYLDDKTVTIVPQGAAPAAPATKPGALDEVVVTGSHIRGGENLAAPLLSFDREAIERSGYTTAQEFLRSLPQNLKGDGGASEDGILMVNGGSNFEVASGANLRGLGTSATLVLINGHRVAPSSYGTTVDLSLIPVSAIERIDVLTDGASAIYGSDAIGGVINIILRKSFDGAETVATAGTVAHGGRREYTVGQTFGRTWDAGRIIASLNYYDANALPTSARSFTAQSAQPTDIYPDTRTYSAFASGEQRFPVGLDLFGDASYAHKVVEQGTSYTGQGVTARTETDSASLNAGVGWHIADAWRIELSGLYSRVESDLTQQYDPLDPSYRNGDPYIDNSYAIHEADLKADGTLLALPGGDLKIALGASHRYENLTSVLEFTNPATPREIARAVNSGFAELRVPLIGPGNAQRWARGLELSAAYRYDRYSSFGATTNPQFGLIWAPVDSLRLKATYGTSFRAPTPIEIIGNASNIVFAFGGYAQPGGGSGAVVAVIGTRPLEPEESRNKTIGLELTPAAVPGLTLALNYLDLQFTQRIIDAHLPPDALVHPEIYGPLIGSFDSDPAAASFVNGYLAQGYRFFDIAGIGPQVPGVRYWIPYAYVNAARVHVSGLDTRIQYAWDSDIGHLTLGLNLAKLIRIDTGFCPSCETTDLSNQYGQPPHLRGRAEASWERHAWQLNAALNRTGSYSDTASVVIGRVDAFTTLEVNARYTLPWGARTTANLSAVNLFDRYPPRTALSAANVTYDPTNASPLGRVVSLQLRKVW